MSAGLLLALALILPATAGGRQPPPRVYDLVAGGEHAHTVVPGDTVWSITGRFAMNREQFDALNPLLDPARLRPGMRVVVADRTIVPRRQADGIVIDLTDRTLYWFARGGLKGRFPVGIGRIDWATPPGRYRIVGRREDPAWHVPASIQKEMREKGEPVVSVVAPGPDNPLGKYWIQLSAPGYGLHGTNAPASVGKYTSHGCIRLLPEHVERLYREAPDGTPVEVVYEPVKLARDHSGAVYLEVHRDIYRHAGAVRIDDVLARIEAAGLGAEVDVARVTDVVARAWGSAENVTRLSPERGAEAAASSAADAR